MSTLGTNIIVPLQPQEIKSGLNNSPYYHRHIFKSSGKSLEGLHPIPLRHIALLNSEERAELLSQCEDIELQWDLDVPRDEKWRYMKTRETLTKLTQNGYGQYEAPKINSDDKSLVVLPHEEASDKVASTSLPDKTQRDQGGALALDGIMSYRLADRDRILNTIAPRNVPAGLSKMDFKTVSDEDSMYAADWFKTSADDTTEKLGFPNPTFNQNTHHANARGVRCPATHKTTRPSPSVNDFSEESHHKASGFTPLHGKDKEQHLRDRKGKKPLLEENASPTGGIDSFTNSSLSGFIRAVTAAAEEDPLSVATVIANWETKSSGRKTPTPTGAEQDPAAQEGGEASIQDSHLRMHYAYSIESLEGLTGPDDDPSSSHQDGETRGSSFEVDPTSDWDNDDDGDEAIDPDMENSGLSTLESDIMSRSDKDMHQNTLHIGADAPLAEGGTCLASSGPPPTQSESGCTTSGDHNSNEELASEDEVEDAPDSSASATVSTTTMAPAPNHKGKASMPSPIEATTHPPDDEGTHIAEAPLLIMPTFPLSLTTAASHELVSNHVAQVLHGSSRRSIADATTTHHLLETVQKPNLEDQLSPHDALEALANQQKHEHRSTPNPKLSISPSAQGITPIASAPTHSEDPVFEAVVFPHEIKDDTSVHQKQPTKLELAAPSLLHFDGEQIDDWAQDLLTVIQDYTFLHPSNDQHKDPNERFDGASVPAESVGPASQDAVPPSNDTHWGRAKLVVDAAEVASDAMEALHDDHVEIQDGDQVEAQQPKEETPKVDMVANPPNAAADPMPHLDPLALLFPIQHPSQPATLYPLAVSQKHTKVYSEPTLLRYLETASGHFSSISCCYVLISIFKPEARAPRDLYLIAGALLGSSWAVMYYIRCKNAQPRTIRHMAESERTANKRWVQVWGALLAVAAVAAAVAYGTYLPAQTGVNLTTVVTSEAVRTKNDSTGVDIDVCYTTFGWTSVFDPMAMYGADTPTPLITIPQDLPTNDATDTWGSTDESDSEFESNLDGAQSSTTDSYGARKAVTKHASSAWSGPLWGIGISIIIGTVKYWWVQGMIEMYLQNYS
jgi:hypothetical protein